MLFYHVLKALAHLAPAVYLTLRRPDARAQCDALEQELAECESAARDASLDEVLRVSHQMLSAFQRGGSVLEHEAVLEYARSVQVSFDRLVKAAAEHEVNALDRAMRELQREIDPRWIPHTFYVVCASHQPRYRELTKMFFLRWAESSSGGGSDARHRVLYAEGRDDLEQAITSLMTERVVDSLQIIQIEHKQCPSAGLVARQMRQGRIERSSIGKFGQGIDGGTPFSLHDALMTFESDRTKMQARLNHGFFKLGRPANLMVVERENAGGGSALIADRARPARLEAEGQGRLFVFCPSGITFDVVDGDGLPEIGGTSARADIRSDKDAVETSGEIGG